MKIDKEIELPMGRVHFVGELTEEELDTVITLGLAMLLHSGKLPMQEVDEGSDTLQ